MNQSSLYAALNYAGCKILSFEDFPSNHGSWRVCFQVCNSLCLVTCNRTDNLLIFSSKNARMDNKLFSMQSSKLLTDQLELAKLNEWIRSLVASNQQTESDNSKKKNHHEFA